MPAVAELIADTVTRRRAPEAVRERARELAVGFDRIGFTFESAGRPPAT
jgi:hypothetical protein